MSGTEARAAAEPTRVAVLGGGIAGLSVAHELARWNERQSDPSRRYEITVFESRGAGTDDLGGKARTWRSPQHQGPALAGEHGFRFFGGFYKNVIATMQEIPAAGAGTGGAGTGGAGTGGASVADQLVPLTESDFYAQAMPIEEGFTRSPMATMLDGRFQKVAALVTILWLLGGPLVISLGELPSWSYLVWIAVMVVWKLLRWSVEARAADGTAQMRIRLRPDGSGERRHPFARGLDRIPLVRWWWLVLVALALWWQPPWPVWVVIGIVCLGWHFHRQLFAMTWLWRNLRGKIPHDVKPRGAESVFAFLSVVALATSCHGRFYEQWEYRSWWEYIGAWRFSDRYKLTLATGLTRGFVATKAEQMSARTGGAILAQLIYDIDPYLTRENAPDRVLNGPTSEVWIRPWVQHLRSQGVKFNEFDVRTDPEPGQVPGTAYPPRGTAWKLDQVVVRRLALDLGSGTRIGAFHWSGEQPDEAIADEPDSSIREEFDHYVLAVSGTAAQQILGNSPELLELDRATLGAARPVAPMSAPDAVPFLEGIFELEFGWMTGIVFHLERRIDDLPAGHLLCLDSEWALTAIDQRAIWAELTDDDSVGTILSVNVSDWFRPSKQGLPARFATVQQIVDQVWDQLCCHVPQLTPQDKPPMDRVLLDKAVRDPDQQTDITLVRRAVDQLVAVHPGVRGGAAGAGGLGIAGANGAALFTQRSCTLELENLPLTNAEKLLINTAASWRSRPCATTSIPNLFIAGDYVRTQVDFASMESANEAGRWAAKALIEEDARRRAAAGLLEVGEDPDPGIESPRGLEVPHEMRWIVRVFRAVDGAMYWLGWPHPASILATPVGWFTKLENRLRDAIDTKFRSKHLPRRPR